MAPREFSAGAGLGAALASAAAFGTSGAFGSSLIKAGWTPAAVVLVRISLATVILAVPAVVALRGRFYLLLRGRSLALLYGVFAVAGAQVFYFNAIERLSVGVALMLEYLGVVLVVGWMWLRHGRRPRQLTLLGSAFALVGLALVLDLFGGARIDFIGVLWGLGAAVGLAAFFVLSARSENALPPVAMASVGMGVGALALLLLGVTGVMPLAATFGTVELAGRKVGWLVPVLGLAVLAAAFAYVVGIFAARILGATLASFVGLTEVIFAVVIAWLLLDELPRTIQLIGGAFIVSGVALVRIDELRRGRRARARVAVGTSAAPPG